MGRAANLDPLAAPAMTQPPAKYIRETPGAANGNGTVDLDRCDEDARISCIMATRGRAFPALHAIACFQSQTYRNRELIVISASMECEVKALVAELNDPRIRFLEYPVADTVGDLRNAAIAEATGDLIAIWDDDDLSDPDRLRWQAAALQQARGDACFLAFVVLWWPSRLRLAHSACRRWENTMLARKAVLPPYSAVRRGGDTMLVETLKASSNLVTIEKLFGYCYIKHDSNLWGDDHFDRLFRDGSAEVSPTDYEQQLAILSERMPLLAYRNGLFAAAVTQLPE